MVLDFWSFKAAFHRIVAAATFAVEIRQALPSLTLTVGVGFAVLVLDVDEPAVDELDGAALDGAVLVGTCEELLAEVLDDDALDEPAAVPAPPPHAVSAIEAAITAAGATTRRLRDRDMSQLCPGGQSPAKST